jgi:hypothetical protein
MLLTDVYPPFSIDDEPGYPVRIALPPRERLNRLAVLFRVILSIPAYLLTTIVSFGGMTIVAFIAWLITLIAGRLPNGLHQAYTTIFRYSTRAICYFYLLTPTYPKGLSGMVWLPRPPRATSRSSPPVTCRPAATGPLASFREEATPPPYS